MEGVRGEVAMKVGRGIRVGVLGGRSRDSICSQDRCFVKQKLKGLSSKETREYDEVASNDRPQRQAAKGALFQR